MESKRIGTFKQFLKEQKMKKLNEEKLSLEIKWWDVAIIEVMQDLTDECYGTLVYDDLVKYIKTKFQILGREIPDDEGSMILAHIKDLIYAHHGDSLYSSDTGDWGEGNSAVQAKGLVVSELAKVIFNKVIETSRTSDESNPVACLVDKEPTTMVPMTPAPIDGYEDDYYEDLPYESKRVYGFEKYSKMIEEAAQQFQLAQKQKVIDYTLQQIEQEAGSLNLEDISQVVVRKYGPIPYEEGHTMVEKYIKSIVVKYLNSKGKVQTWVKNNEDMYLTKNVLKGIFNLLAEMVVSDIVDMLAEKSRKEEEEDEEVE